MTTHRMFDGRVQLFKRGRVWWCAASVGKERFRDTTKEEDLDRAKDVAEEWYLDLRGKLRRGEVLQKEHTFREVADLYLRDAKVLAAGVRSPKYIEFMDLRMKVHILPFFGDKPLSEVNKSLVQAYRVKRAEETIKKTAKAATKAQPARPGKRAIAARPALPGKPPARSTMLQEIVHIRQVLKHASALGWITHIPDLTTPYMTQGKKGRRAWFSPEEYKTLREATRDRITKGKRPGYKGRYEDMHDFVVFMANTGLRPDEAKGLEFRDVKIEDDYATRKTILVIDVRGKTGVGYCKSMPGAVHPFQQLRDRRIAELKREGLNDKAIAKRLPMTCVFRKYTRGLFNIILAEEGLKYDRDGKPRTAYSLRHTYISMRLMEGANIHQIANNCRTSVQMIEEHYASHIKDRLDAAAINVQRPRAARKGAKAADERAAKSRMAKRKTVSNEGEGAST